MRIRVVAETLSGLFLVPFLCSAAAPTLQLVTGSGEFQQLLTSLTVSNPAPVFLQWTAPASAVSGAWQVTTKSAANQAIVVAKGALTQAPSPGHFDRFTIGAGVFLTAAPPPAPKSYEITITALDKKSNPVGSASPAVTVTQQPSGPPSPPVNLNNLNGPASPDVEPYPRVRMIRYSPLTQTDPGQLELEFYNDQKISSEAVQVRISDLNLVARQKEGLLAVNKLGPGQFQKIVFTLVPQLTLGSPSIEEDWDKWRTRYSTSGIRILAGTSKPGSPVVDWHQPPFAGEARWIRCGSLPVNDPLFADLRDCISARVAALMTENDGVSGVFLKQVQGPVRAALNQDFVFEPASAIKVLFNLYAFRLMEANPGLTQNFVLPYFTDYSDGSSTPACQQLSGSSCPKDSGSATTTLREGLREMMQCSDNRLTQAMRVFLGQGNVDLMAIEVVHMNHTLYQHRDGCGDEAIAHPNRLTLTDAGLLYEGVSTGALLKPATRTGFYSVMLGKQDFIGNDLAAIAQAEMPAGMLPEKLSSFLNAMDVHFKAGSYGLNDGFNRTLAGSATIPFRINGAVVLRDYVFGLFVSKASTEAKADAAWNAARAEVLREQIRDALLTW